jgi:Zn-dependent M28 family amino/carboxypeptidase
VAALQRYAPLFERLGADTIEEGYAGVDLIPLSETGVLSLGIHPDGSTYFDYHHSPADTLDRIDPRHLQRNAAALALMAFILAERE